MVVDECLAVMNRVHINIFLILGEKTVAEKYYSAKPYILSFFFLAIE